MSAGMNATTSNKSILPILPHLAPVEMRGTIIFVLNSDYRTDLLRLKKFKEDLQVSYVSLESYASIDLICEALERGGFEVVESPSNWCCHS